MDDHIELGSCCGCGKSGTDVRNVMMLDRKGPTPGKGWGCFVCGLPMDGAMAVLCDDCLEADAEIQFVCVGYPATDGRMAITELANEPFEHDLIYHPEIIEGLERGNAEGAEGAEAWKEEQLSMYSMQGVDMSRLFRNR